MMRSRFQPKVTSACSGNRRCSGAGVVDMRSQPIRTCPPWSLRTACWFFVVLYLPLTIGCGGDNSRASKAEIEAAMKARAAKDAEEAKKRQAAAKKRELALRQKQIAAAKKRAEKQAVIRERTTPIIKQAPKAPTFPEKIADWRKDDYNAARDWSEPRYCEAVAYLGHQFAGNESAARLLSNLLQAQEKKEEGTRNRLTRRRNTIEEVDAVVAALFENGTEPAWDTLRGLATETFPAEHAKEGRDAAVRVLLSDPSKRSEDILFGLLTQPAAVLPDRSHASTRDKVGTTILSAIDSDTHWDSLRIRLATWLAASPTDYARSQPLRRVLERPVIANLSAQLILYKGVGPSTEIKERMEIFLGQCSERALQIAFEVPQQIDESPVRRVVRGNDRSRVDDSELSDSEQLAHIARYLWAPTSADIVVKRLQQVDSLPSCLRLLRLASSMPVDRVRLALSETFDRNWEDGPPNLGSVGGGSADTTSDPGLIVSLKSILAERDPTNRATRARPRSVLARGARPVSNPAQLAAIRRQQEYLAAKWWQACGQVVLRLCRQMEAAGVANRLTDQTSELPKSSEELLELHPDARVVAEHRIFLPEQLPADIAGSCASEITVVYFRVEERGLAKNVLKFYQRQLKDAKAQVTADSVWLSGLRDAPENGRRHSLDVIIRTTGGELHPQDEIEGRLSVDVLCITIPWQTAEGTAYRASGKSPPEASDDSVAGRPEAG